MLLRRAVTASACLLALTACGGDDEPATAPTQAAPSPTATTSTPAPTATTPSPEPTSSTPAPVRSYGTEGELTDERQVEELPAAPDDFKTFLKRELRQARADQGCASLQVTVGTLDERGWASGSYFDTSCGGTAVLWARTDGTWRTAWEGQTLVDCETLERYRFPASVAGRSCDDGTAEVRYPRR